MPVKEKPISLLAYAVGYRQGIVDKSLIKTKTTTPEGYLELEKAARHLEKELNHINSRTTEMVHPQNDSIEHDFKWYQQQLTIWDKHATHLLKSGKLNQHQQHHLHTLKRNLDQAAAAAHKLRTTSVKPGIKLDVALGARKPLHHTDLINMPE